MIDPGSLINVLTGQPIPADTIRQLFTRQLGNPEVTAKFRVVDASLDPLDVMPGQDDPSDISSLIVADSTAKVSCDGAKPVPTQVQFTMRDPADVGLDIPFPFFPGRDLIQVFQVHSLPGMRVEVPRGYYCDFKPTQHIKPNSLSYTWAGQGLMSLANKKFMSDWCIEPGYAGGYVQAMTDILTCDSTPISDGGNGSTPFGLDCAGPGIPLTRIAIDKTGNQPVLFPMMFAAGSDMNKALKQLADAITYYPVGDDSLGYFKSWPRWNYKTGNPPWNWDYSTDPTISIIEGQIDRDIGNTTDVRGWNIVKVIGETTANAQVIIIGAVTNTGVAQLSSVEGLHDGDSISLSSSNVSETRTVQNVDPTTNLVTFDQNLSATYTGGTATYHPSFISILVNKNPDSLVSTVNLLSIGGGPRYLPYFERNNQIGSQDMCALRAYNLLQQGAMAVETLKFNSLWMPLAERYDLSICRVTKQNGTEVVSSSTTALFEEQAWEMPLYAGGRHSHTLQRAQGI